MTIRQLCFGETDGYRPWAETAIETYSTQLCATVVQLANQSANQNPKRYLNASLRETKIDAHFCD